MEEISSEIMNGVIIIAVAVLLVFVVWSLKSFAIRFKEWVKTLTGEQARQIVMLTPIFTLLFMDWQALCALASLIIFGAVAVVGYYVFRYGDQLGL